MAFLDGMCKVSLTHRHQKGRGIVIEGIHARPVKREIMNQLRDQLRDPPKEYFPSKKSTAFGERVVKALDDLLKSPCRRTHLLKENPPEAYIDISDDDQIVTIYSTQERIVNTVFEKISFWVNQEGSNAAWKKRITTRVLHARTVISFVPNVSASL